MARTKGSKNKKKKIVKKISSKKRKYTKSKNKKLKEVVEELSKSPKLPEVNIYENEINFHKIKEGDKHFSFSFSNETAHLMKDIFKEIKAI